MDEVCHTHQPIIITRQGTQPVVMMSLEDYNGITETGYLLASPKNAARLRQSISDAKSGKYACHHLLAP